MCAAVAAPGLVAAPRHAQSRQLNVQIRAGPGAVRKHRDRTDTFGFGIRGESERFEPLIPDGCAPICEQGGVTRGRERQATEAYSYSNTNALVHDRASYLVGTPEGVVGRLAALHQDVRFDHFAYWARLPGLSHARAMESLHMVASRVLPALVATNHDNPAN
jgi:hypothetical protein